MPPSSTTSTDDKASTSATTSTSSSTSSGSKKRRRPQRKRQEQQQVHAPTWGQEFLLGGISTACACLISNPFDVIKTRTQLQGELQAKGTYEITYRNLFHAGWTIARLEGIGALQRGLGPAVVYQFVMNGVRLGTFQTLVNLGFTQSKKKQPPPPPPSQPLNTHTQPPSSSSSSSYISSDFAKSVLAGAVGGCLGGIAGSPLYLVKVHLQSQSFTKEIAVGHQYSHRGTFHGLKHIYSTHGLRGLWRGVEGAVPRLMLGSALQLSTFSYIKDTVHRTGYVSEAWVPVAASLLSSVNIVIFMEPLDVVRTRLYNQPVDVQGKGLFYRGFWDCFTKIGEKEGLHGFYKGAWAAYFRMAPQAILGLSFWDTLRRVWYGRGGVRLITREEAEGEEWEEEEEGEGGSGKGQY